MIEALRTRPVSPDIPRITPSLELIPNPQTFHKALSGDIRAARHSVKLLFFTFHKDDQTQVVFDSLEEAAKNNVHVQILYDHIGFNPRTLLQTHLAFRKLRKMGVEIKKAHQPHESMHPAKRNHKKLAIIDGSTSEAKAYIGSTNLSGKQADWNDFMVRTDGHAAAAINDMFNTTWNGNHQEALHYDIGDPDKTAIISDSKNTRYILDRTLEEIRNAQRRIWIESGYFDKDEVQQALIEAKRKNPSLDIKIIGPTKKGLNDWRYRFRHKPFLDPLLEAGITGVYIYGHDEGKVNHAKVFIADDMVSIGSFNYTGDIFTGSNAEVALFTQNAAFRKQMEEWFLRDRGISFRYEGQFPKRTNTKR